MYFMASNDTLKQKFVSFIFALIQYLYFITTPNFCKLLQPVHMHLIIDVDLPSSLVLCH